MPNKRFLWIGAYVAATAVLIAGIAVVVTDQASDDPASSSAAALPDLAPMPYPSTLTLEGPSAGSVGSQFSFSAQGYSENPTATISLYDGATRISTTKPLGDGSAQVTFPALSVGPHALHAEVTDTKGDVSLTPVVPVAVHVATSPTAVQPYAPPGEPAPEPPRAATGEETVAVPVPADEGETPQELAKRFNLDPSQITVAQVPAGFSPTDPIPTGAVALANVKPDAGLKATISDIATVTNPEVTAGTKLKLTGKADGCGVSLTAKGADGPVFFFDANGGVPGWASVGETDGDGTLELPAPPPGAHTYFARTDTTKSLPVSVAVPLKCSGNAGWTGDAKIIEGVLYLPPKAQGGVILYLALDGGTSVRIPEQNAINAGYETDISSMLPALSGQNVALQVWQATEFNAQKVATGSLTVPDGTELSSVIGEPGIIRLTTSAPKGATDALGVNTRTYILDNDDATFTLDWEAQSSRVDEVLYRVYSSIPAPSSLTGPSIFASGISERSGDGPTSKGSFKIDTADIPGHEAVADRNAEIEAGGSGAMPSTENAGLDLLEGLKSYTPPATPQTLGKVKGFKASAPTKVGTQIDPLLLQPASMLPGPGDLVYVDVVANPNGPAIGTTSNDVAIVLPTPVPAEDASSGVTLVADEVVLDPGRAPNPAMGNCASITLPSQSAIDAYYPEGTNTAAVGPIAFYPQGSGTYCLVPGTPEACVVEDIPIVGGYACDLGQAIEDGVDTFIDVLLQFYALGTQIYNGAISGVVDIIAKFNPICLAITAGDQNAGKSCEMVAGIVAHAAITAVLASFGLPPSLPSLSELEALGRGELAVVAVALMKQAGIPCDDVKPSPELAESLQAAGGELGAGAEVQALSDPCLALAGAVLDAVIAEVKQGATNQMASATGLADFSSIPGFEMKPDSRSIPSPMTVTYTARVEKFDAQSSGLVCRVAMLPSAPSRGQAYPYPFSFPGPGAGQGQTFPLVESDDPVFGKGIYSGSGVLTNYGARGTALADVLIDLDEQMAVRAEGQCVGGKATTNAKVRPYEE